MTSLSHVRARRADRVAGRSVASERGETLIEVMFTVVLLGTGFVAILSAIFTSTRISDANQQRTKASISVQAVAESLLQPALDPPANPGPTYFPQQSYTYVACASPQTYGSGGGQPWVIGDINLRDYDLPTHYTATITKIRYLTGFDASGQPQWSAASTAAGDAANNACYTSYYRSKVVKDISTNPCEPDKIPPDFSGCGFMTVDNGLQEITVKIDSAARRDRVADTLIIIKRDQRCPGTYDNADLGPC